jgi:MFS family permease
LLATIFKTGWKMVSAMLFRMRDRIFYGWVVVVALLIILTIILGTRATFGVFFKSIESEFNLTRAATSGIFSAYMVLCAVSAILGGLAADRYGPRIVIFIMGLFTGASLLLTSQATSSWQLFITYSLLLAVGTGAGFVVVTATASRWFVTKRGLALGITTSGEGLGALIMAPFAVYLISSLNWRMALVVMSLVTGVTMTTLSLLLRKSPAEIGALPDELNLIRKDGAMSGKSGHAPASLSLREAFRTRSFWLLGIIWLLYSLCYHLVVTHIVPRATDIGITPAKAALVLALIGGGNILGRLAMGTASDKLGRKISAIVCALVQVASMTWVAWSNDLWMFYLFALVYGFGFGGLSTCTTALVGDTFGIGNLGVITGALVIGFSLGAAVGPIVGGFIFDVTDDYFIAFMTGAPAMLIVALLVALIRTRTAIRRT